MFEKHSMYVLNHNQDIVNMNIEYEHKEWKDLKNTS